MLGCLIQNNPICSSFGISSFVIPLPIHSNSIFFPPKKPQGNSLAAFGFAVFRHKVAEGVGFDVSDVKTLRWSVFTSGVTQSKEYGAGGCAARHGRLCDGDRIPQAVATPGSRPKKRKRRLDRMARALEFPRLRRRNSMGSMRRFVSANNRGAHPCGARPCCWRRGWFLNVTQRRAFALDGGARMW